MDDAIRFIETPQPLRDPILVAAPHGVGALTPGVVAGLLEQHAPQPLAEVDPDEFYDFTSARPMARITEGQRSIVWPDIRFTRVALEDRDLVVVAPIEPALRWRRFAAIVQEVAHAFGIRDVIVLSAFGGATPHTRPLPVHWLAVSPDTPARFGLEPIRPRYQGPATFSIALAVMLRDAGFSVGTLNAIAPFYLGVDPSPHAVGALARALDRELGLDLDLNEVDRQVEEVERQAAEQLADSEQLRTFLANLEEQYDAEAAMVDTAGESRAPVALESDAVLADVEAFLREQRS